MSNSSRVGLLLLAGVVSAAQSVSAQPCSMTPCESLDDWNLYCGAAPGLNESPCGAGYPYGEAGEGSYPCQPPAAACGPPPPVWVLSIGALYLERDHGNNYTFSYDDPNEELQYLNQRDADFDWAPGFEARLTKFNCCTQRGVELLYWQLFPSDQTANVYGADLAGNLSAILNYDQLDYNATTSDNYTNNAFAHRLRREMAVYNVEANHVVSFGDCTGCTTLSSLIGFRLFRFDEALQFASDPNDGMFTYETDELYYSINTDNTLLGGQLGGYASHRVGCHWSFTASAKAGVYANFAEGYSHIGGAAGTATINNGTFTGRMWRVDNDKTDVAMLAEVSLGVVYTPTACWRIAADYRVIGASGVALPTNQIYSDLRGINDVELLQTNGHVLLHGGFVGVERVW